MSIKGSSKKLKIEFVFSIFIIATIIATAVRTYQYFTIIAHETGFYSVENFSVGLLYGILALSGMLIFVISYLAKKVPQATLPEKKNMPLAFASLIAAATFLADAVYQLKECSSGFSQTASTLSVESGSYVSYLVKSGIGPKGLEGIFAVFCAIYFLIFAAKYFGASVNIKNRKILAVAPVFWATLRMVQRFTRTISFIFVSDLLLELFMIAFMMMFFLSFAQLSSDVNSRHVMNKIYAYGLIGAMFSCVVAVPRVIYMIANQTLSVQPDPLEICDIGFMIFAVVLCFALIKLPKDDNITLKDVEKLQKQREDEEKENAKDE